MCTYVKFLFRHDEFSCLLPPPWNTLPAMSDAQNIPDKTTGWRGSRALWLAAAREAFLDSGLDAVKIQPLALRLGLSRTSFYWFFPDRAALLDALLEDWEETNTGTLTAAAEAYAETIAEAVLNLIGVFLPGGGFESRLDFAVRGWAHQSEEAASRVNAADEIRLSAIRAMFARFGYAEGEADVRARTVYLVQIGYISMQVEEDLDTRLARIPDYVMSFTGTHATESELSRFHARHAASR